MKITADTNILLRVIILDDAGQAAVARTLRLQATVIAIPGPVLCEFAGMPKWGSVHSAGDVATAIKTIAQIDTVVTDLQTIGTGLRILRAGGDFADGAIALQGEALGGTAVASFGRDRLPD